MPPVSGIIICPRIGTKIMTQSAEYTRKFAKTVMKLHMKDFAPRGSWVAGTAGMAAIIILPRRKTQGAFAGRCTPRSHRTRDRPTSKKIP